MSRVKTLLVAAFVLSLVGTGVHAQGIMAFKKGETTDGMTKQCFYDALGSLHTRTISSVELCPLSITVPAVPTPSSNRRPDPNPVQGPPKIVAFKKGEVVTNMTKQCFYNGLGNTYTKTISAVELCPLSIQVPLLGR